MTLIGWRNGLCLYSFKIKCTPDKVNNLYRICIIIIAIYFGIFSLSFSKRWNENKPKTGMNEVLVYIVGGGGFHTRTGEGAEEC